MSRTDNTHDDNIIFGFATTFGSKNKKYFHSSHDQKISNPNYNYSWCPIKVCVYQGEIIDQLAEIVRVLSKIGKINRIRFQNETANTLIVEYKTLYSSSFISKLAHELSICDTYNKNHDYPDEEYVQLFYDYIDPIDKQESYFGIKYD
jgi:hypothetical protein